MTTMRPEPIEQVETAGNSKKLVAIIHPLKQHGQDTNDRKQNGDLDDKYDVTFKDLPLIDLLSENSPLNVKLCLMLNRSNNRVIRNWKHLAHAIGVPSDVSLSFDCDSEQSPTADLFDYLITWNPEMNFTQLKAKLKDAGRNDLILKLDKDGYQDVWKIADNMEFVDMFKDKLDIPKRHMDWRALANKLKIPRKKWEKFGKPKLGPTEHLFLHIRISTGLADLTVGKIKKCLSDMDRFDVLKVFERLKLLDNALAKDEFKSQSPLMDELSGLLDKDGPMKNWRNLAYNLGIPGDIYQDFDMTRVNNKNPTDLLIEWIFANKPDFTVGMMVKCLQSIGRNDVVVELRNGVKQDIERKKLYITTTGEKAGSVVKRSSQSLDSLHEESDSKLPQNVDHLSKQERLDLQVTSLPNSLYQRVCNMLDTEESFFRDYRMLAEELGMDKTNINRLQKVQTPTHSILLDYKITVDSFVTILKNIEREDVANEVEDWLEKSPSC